MSRLLIIEDDEDMLSSYRTILEKEGHEVYAVDSAEKALDILTAEKLDLVVTDLLLPGVDGPELCRMIRDKNAWRCLPVVLVTCMRKRIGLEITPRDSCWAPFSRVIDKSSAVKELPLAVRELTRN